MIDVKVIFTDNNKRYQVIRAYDGFALHSSGKFKNMQNCEASAAKLITSNNNWRLVGDVVR